MNAHSVDDLAAAQSADSVEFLEFVRSRSMSVGVYSLPAGATDPQDPHAEDEVYLVVEGRAKIEVDGEVEPVEPGDVVYVERGVDHRFLDVE